MFYYFSLFLLKINNNYSKKVLIKKDLWIYNNINNIVKLDCLISNDSFWIVLYKSEYFFQRELLS